MKLNSAQQLAVEHKEGPALILAGPGSGKTAVITERTRRLIESGILEENILVITFTKAAATEMQARFEKLWGQKSKVSFGTFHSIFFKILKFAKNYNSTNIIRDEDSYRILLNLIDKHKLEAPDISEMIGDIKEEISMVKSRNDIEIGKDGLLYCRKNLYCAKSIDNQVFSKVYTGYCDELKRRRLVDFDDMLLETFELFKNDETVLDLWREQYRYIMIDEFQDINAIQYEIVRMLATPGNNLFVVGDDDQSIYGFRGSNPSIMMAFKNDYIGCKEILLNYNYRSKKSIVDAAGRVITNNKNRFQKEILTVHEEGNPVEIISFLDTNAENVGMTEIIKAMKAKGVLLQEMAVLYRTNTQAQHIMSALLSANIPFVLKDGVLSLYDHWAVRDVMAYIFMALGDRRRDIFTRIMNKPKRFFSRDVFFKDPVDFEDIKSRFSEKRWLTEAIEKMEYDFKLIARGTPYSAVTYIRRAIGYDDYIRDYVRERGLNEEEILTVLDELTNEATGYVEFEDWFENISKMRQELLRQKELDKSIRHPAVTLSTMHSSKGLEYDVVLMPDCVESICPYKKAITEENIEEERRLFYVAMTRARMRLFVLTVEKFMGKVVEKSRFVKEMEKNEG